ncbi:membrane protein [Saccharothrix mutabilis subsp. mutabilis]|uniref:Membrane protein n=1 Tax=Saccharothrix mutabilis subsp. mutabilis TaxID=66855 RepID=A0ABP3DEN0_9PSEU
MLAALTPVPATVAPLRRVPQLFAGLWLYGASMALQIRATLGLDPWDVLHEGLAKRSGLSFGTVTMVVGALVLLAWIPLRQRPGVGTVSNVVLIGVAVDVTLWLLPTPSDLVVRAVFLVAGIVLNGLAAAVYIGARLGPGPRDGVTTGFCRRTGASLRLVRTVVEVAVLGAGWLLGGTVGLGTVLYAVTIGPLTQLFLPLVTWVEPKVTAVR